MRALAAAALAAAVAVPPVAASAGQMFYKTVLNASATITSGSGSMSIARAVTTEAAPAVTVTSRAGGAATYMIFLDAGLDATDAQRNLRGADGATAYRLCRDPDCDVAWDGDGADGAATPIIVTSGSTTTSVPIYAVVRDADAAKTGRNTDVVTLTMYF